MLARGAHVANLRRENSRAVWGDDTKLMEEKEIPPEETSGTPDSVLREGLQVIRFWISATTLDTSAGRTSLPMMKQGLA